MVTISLELPDELAQRLTPLQDRLAEIIEIGLRQLQTQTEAETETDSGTLKSKILAALYSTGIVTLPEPSVQQPGRVRRTPIKAGGPPASEMIIAERHRNYD